jgi:protein-tyrosine-phosphatase
MDLPSRARMHAALGDEMRLRLIDAIWLNDRSPQELGRLLEVDSNLLAHHLDVLEEAGLITRTVSEGDRRRRYVSARLDVLEGMVAPPRMSADTVLFVCTHNSARSLFAERLLVEMGSNAQSAGTQPAEHAHPKAVAAAAELGVDLTASRPRPCSAVEHEPDLVVSVCDRAGESISSLRADRLHWSIPDPVDTGRIESFRNAFAEISNRVERLSEILEREGRVT